MLGRHALTDLDSLGLCTIGTKYFLSQIFIKVNCFLDSIKLWFNSERPNFVCICYLRKKQVSGPVSASSWPFTATTKTAPRKQISLYSY